jgi:hypothetical protein
MKSISYICSLYNQKLNQKYNQKLKERPIMTKFQVLTPSETAKRGGLL